MKEKAILFTTINGIIEDVKEIKNNLKKFLDDDKNKINSKTKEYWLIFWAIFVGYFFTKMWDYLTKNMTDMQTLYYSSFMFILGILAIGITIRLSKN